MEPSPKRPRLSVLSGDAQPTASLSQARWRNDLCLKSRFETIFEKYSHDFTGIGDEIDISTGSIVVNNGHLTAMEDEGDIGTPTTPPQSKPGVPRNINGGTLLRAMTIALEDRGPPFEHIDQDKVMMSIEAMAENAALYSDANVPEFEEPPTDSAEVDEGDNSNDEELFQAPNNSGGNFSYDSRTRPPFAQVKIISAGFASPEEYCRPAFLGNDITPDVQIKQEKDYEWPDTESLFSHREIKRSSSPDSLFEAQEHVWDAQSFLQQRNHETPSTTAHPELENNTRELSDDAIIDKFGPRVGSQVLDVLHKRGALLEAHIEPAWRIPVVVAFTPPKLESPPDDLRPSEKPNGKKSESIWKVSRPNRSRCTTKYRTAHRANRSGDESDDPLQEDFREVNQEKMYEGYEEAVSLDDVEEGVCPFCQKQFSLRASVYAHWDDLIKKSVRDGIHDMAYIRRRRSHKRRRTQYPKVTVEGFRKMIQLHEINQMDWIEVQEQGFFGPRPASSLQDMYYHYRTIAKTDDELAAEGRSWATEEDQELLDLCRDPNITFHELRKAMKTRTQAELGNRLASIWTQQYAEEGIELMSPKLPRSHEVKAVRRAPSRTHQAGQLRLRSSTSTTSHRSGSFNSVGSLFMVDEFRNEEYSEDLDNDRFG